MLTAIHRRFGALDIEARQPGAGVMEATLATDVQHSVLRMLLAVCPLLAALDVEVRPLSARVA